MAVGSGRLLHCRGNAAWNMAVDEALLCLAAGRGEPVLRFYQWQQPAISLGRFQDLARSIDLGRCQEEGIEVVRRPTGGRAVYHNTDLTYAILLPESVLRNRSISGSYRAISDSMARGISTLGLKMNAGSEPSPGRHSRTDCFAHTAAADLALNGAKAIGSAQVRCGGWLLQQGSIRLWPQSMPAGVFLDGASDVSFAGGMTLTREEVSRVISRALGDLLEREWREDEPLPAEELLADRLARQKYSCSCWTVQGEETVCSLDS